MKMNNVSFAIRAMNQNLRNQKFAPKNPSFGSTIYTKNKKLLSNDPVKRAKEVEALKKIAEAIRENYTAYKHSK